MTTDRVVHRSSNGVFVVAYIAVMQCDDCSQSKPCARMGFEGENAVDLCKECLALAWTRTFFGLRI